MKKKWFQKLHVQTHLISTEIALIVRLHFWVGHGNVLLENELALKHGKTNISVFFSQKKTQN